MIRYLVAAALIAGTAVPALAQETQASAAAKFKAEFTASDTNKDGVLSRAEVQARMSHMRMNAQPVDAIHAKRMADMWFNAADTNKDGKVTLAESQALLAATFKRYDANGDGVVGEDERTDAKGIIERGRK